MKTEDTVSCVLKEAASYMSEHGWACGSFEDFSGAVCLIGSISRVVYGRAEPPSASGDTRRNAVFAAALERVASHVPSDATCRCLGCTASGYEPGPESVVENYNDGGFCNKTAAVKLLRRAANGR